VAYPEALVERLPEEWLPYVLYYRGDLDVLTQRPSAWWARPAHRRGRGLARELGAWLAAQDHGVVSGYSRGVERLALDAARSAGGAVIWVLPLGLGQAEGILRPFADDLAGGRGLALSPYAPEVAYREELAGARRVLVVALSTALVAVEPDDNPAEWPSLPEFLQAGGRALVWPAVATWTAAGAAAVGGLSEAQAEIAGLFGEVAAGTEEIAWATSAARTAYSASPSVRGRDSAVEVLGRQRQRARVLARAWRATGKPHPERRRRWPPFGADD
jgi:hypothetical protein